MTSLLISVKHPEHAFCVALLRLTISVVKKTLLQDAAKKKSQCSAICCIAKHTLSSSVKVAIPVYTMLTHTLDACTTSLLPHAPTCVFMRGVSCLCYKTVHAENFVHRARCQRRWAGPRTHGAAAIHARARNQDPQQGGRKERTTRLRVLVPQVPPAKRVTTPPPILHFFVVFRTCIHPLSGRASGKSSPLIWLNPKYLSQNCDGECVGPCAYVLGFS